MNFNLFTKFDQLPTCCHRPVSPEGRLKYRLFAASR